MLAGPSGGNRHGEFLRIDSMNGKEPWTYHILDRFLDDALEYEVFADRKLTAIVSRPVSLNAWHHVMATHDASANRMELFVDGVSQVQSRAAQTACQDADLYIGGCVRWERAQRIRGERQRSAVVVDRSPHREFRPPRQACVADAGTTFLLCLDRRDPPPAANLTTARAGSDTRCTVARQATAADTGRSRGARLDANLQRRHRSGLFSPARRARPGQQAVSISGVGGSIGRYRYLLWEARRRTSSIRRRVFPNTSTRSSGNSTCTLRMEIEDDELQI